MQPTAADGAEEVYCLPNAQVAAAAKSRGRCIRLWRTAAAAGTDDAPPPACSGLLSSVPFEATAIVQCIATGVSPLLFPSHAEEPQVEKFGRVERNILEISVSSSVVNSAPSRRRHSSVSPYALYGCGPEEATGRRPGPDGHSHRRRLPYYVLI